LKSDLIEFEDKHKNLEKEVKKIFFVDECLKVDVSSKFPTEKLLMLINRALFQGY